MPILNALIGIVLLLFGRRLFWFFVTAAGFALGMYVAHEHLRLNSDALVLTIALLAGLAGALLAVLLHKLAVGIAGFAAGALVGAALVRGFSGEEHTMIGFAVGGVLGAVILILAFEWALIVLSSLLGASLIADEALAGSHAPLVFLVALIVGIVIQALQRQRAREKRPKAEHGRERRR